MTAHWLQSRLVMWSVQRSSISLSVLLLRGLSFKTWSVWTNNFSQFIWRMSALEYFLWVIWNHTLMLLWKTSCLLFSCHISLGSHCSIHLKQFVSLQPKPDFCHNVIDSKVFWILSVVALFSNLLNSLKTHFENILMGLWMVILPGGKTAWPRFLTGLKFVKVCLRYPANFNLLL